MGCGASAAKNKEQTEKEEREAREADEAENVRRQKVKKRNEAGKQLVAAARAGDSEAIKKALVACEEAAPGQNLASTYLEPEDPEGKTPSALSAAVKEKQVEAVKQLIQAKVDVNASLHANSTALMTAASVGDADMIKLLCDAGANANKLAPKDAGTVGTCLAVAVNAGSVPAIHALLQAGANINSNELKAQGQDFTVTMMATMKGDKAMVQVLCEAKADVNKLCMSGAVTPLTFLAKSTAQLNATQEEILKTLLNAKADTNLQASELQCVPLYLASSCGQLAAVQMLCEAGASIEIGAKNGATPVYGAAQHGKPLIAKYLIDSKANVNAPLVDGSTPLYVASQEGHVDIVDMLCKAGADVNLVGPKSTTPIFISAHRGHIQVVDHLINARGDPKVCANDGTSPLSVAQQSGHPEVAALLSK